MPFSHTLIMLHVKNETPASNRVDRKEIDSWLVVQYKVCLPSGTPLFRNSSGGFLPALNLAGKVDLSATCRRDTRHQQTDFWPPSLFNALVPVLISMAG